MRDRATMNCGIAALSGRLFGGALLTVTLLIGSSRGGLVRMANGFPAGMSAIRNRYLSEMFAPSGSWVTVERMETGNDH